MKIDKKAAANFAESIEFEWIQHNACTHSD